MKIEGLETGISRYGAESEGPLTAAAVLRSKAANHNIQLLRASSIDLAAASIGADAWMLVNKADNLQLPLQYGEGAVKALAAILARAAGQAEGPAFVMADQCASSADLIRAAESHGRWAYRLIGAEASEALRCAASDLFAAGPSSRLSSYAELLVIVADGLDAPVLFK